MSEQKSGIGVFACKILREASQDYRGSCRDLNLRMVNTTKAQFYRYQWNRLERYQETARLWPLLPQNGLFRLSVPMLVEARLGMRWEMTIKIIYVFPAPINIVNNFFVWNHVMIGKKTPLELLLFEPVGLQ